jgi:nucleoside 2-deoxyribosyltransferase
MSSFYLASRMGRRDELKTARRHLLCNGFRVTSTWLDSDDDDELDEDKISETDLYDIHRADGFILWNQHAAANHSGRLTELGVAIGEHKNPIYIVGPKTNVFMSAKAVTEVFEDWPACFGVIASLEQKVIDNECR